MQCDRTRVRDCIILYSVRTLAVVLVRCTILRRSNIILVCKFKGSCTFLSKGLVLFSARCAALYGELIYDFILRIAGWNHNGLFPPSSIKTEEICGN